MKRWKHYQSLQNFITFSCAYIGITNTVCCVVTDWPVGNNTGMPQQSPKTHVVLRSIGRSRATQGCQRQSPKYYESGSEAHIGLSKFRHYLAHQAGPALRPLTLISNSNCTKYNLRSQSFDNLNSKLYMTATSNIRGPVPFQNFNENLSVWKLIWYRP